MGTSGPRTDTREAIVDHASTLFRERGFRASSIGDVVERCGLQKGALYHYFPSKESLGHAVLDRWIEQLRTRLLAELCAAEGPPPLDRIARFLDQFVAEQEAGQCRGGCPLGTLAAEMADVHEGFRARLAETFGSITDAIATQLGRAQAVGDLRPDADVRALGMFLVAVVEGGVLLAKVHQSVAPLANATRIAQAHLAALRPGWSRG